MKIAFFLLRPNLAEVPQTPGTIGQVLGRRFFAVLTPPTDREGECISAPRSLQKIVWCKPQNHGIIGTNRMVG